MSEIETTLGRLTRLGDLRAIWPNEATDFTPWLANPENLAVLGETLNIDLELEAQEQSVGPFRADILCKDTGTDTWVLIENQLERTDHNHLGQLLTYASGLQAVTIVWIAAEFTEEHRATLDWLNKITDESFRFFGLEVELWRIADSPAAPKFNVVSKPNNWSRSVARAARVIDDAELSETRVTQRKYWAALNTVFDATGGTITGHRKPQPQSWMEYSIGRSGFHLSAVAVRLRNQVRAELYISGGNAKAFFGLLQQQKDAIEEEFGFSLEWEELPARTDCRISYHLEDSDPENEADWPRQHEWLVQRLNDMHRVFAQRVRALKVEDWHADGD